MPKVELTGQRGRNWRGISFRDDRGDTLFRVGLPGRFQRPTARSQNCATLCRKLSR